MPPNIIEPARRTNIDSKSNQSDKGVTHARKTVLAGLLAGLLSLAGLTCMAAEQLKFATGVKGSANYYLPLMAAEEKGFWKENSLQVEWVPFRGGGSMFRSVAAGAVKIGFTGTPSVVQATSFIKKNPGWSMEKMKQVSGYSDRAAQLIYDGLKYSPDGKIDPKAIANVRGFLIDFGIIEKEKAPDVAALYSDRFTR